MGGVHEGPERDNCVVGRCLAQAASALGGEDDGGSVATHCAARGTSLEAGSGPWGASAVDSHEKWTLVEASVIPPTSQWCTSKWWVCQEDPEVPEVDLSGARDRILWTPRASHR